MNPVYGFLLCAAFSVALALGVALALRQALGGLLADLCGSEERGRFWTLYSCVSLPLAALFGVLWSAPAARADGAGMSLADCASVLRFGLWGLLGAMALQGFVLMRAVASYERGRGTPRSAEPRA